MPRIRRAAALAAAALAAAPAAAAADTTLDTVPAPTSVAASGGVAAWSTFSPTTKTYALTLSVHGNVHLSSIGTRSVPFDVDVGTGPDGATWVVYTRCRTEAVDGRPAQGCDLYGFSLAGGTEGPEQKLSASGARNETEPAISGNRVAFLRDGAVVSGPVTGSGRARPVRGAVPTRTCATPGSSCRPIRDVTVTGLDLSGRHVAVASAWGAIGPNGNGVAQSAIVLAHAGMHGAPRAVAFATDGRAVFGPSITGNAVGWYDGCADAASGCAGGAGSWLYAPGSHGYWQAAGSTAVLDYAALPLRRAVEVLAGRPGGCGLGDGSKFCSIVHTEALDYRAVQPPAVPVRLG